MMQNGRPMGVFKVCIWVGRVKAYFGVPTDKEFALARVDTEARERVDLDLLYSRDQILVP